MSLPILTHRPPPEPADLVRFYHRTELHWAQQLGDETQLDVGTAFANPRLAHEFDANQVLDASLPDGLPPVEAVEIVRRHFAERGARCLAWVMNPSAPPDRTTPLAEHLLALGYALRGCDIMYLAGSPASPIEEVAGLTIIPARASFRHARQLAEMLAREWTAPDLPESLMLHLEDPHTDSLIALRDSEPVALVAVLTVGEIGCIEHLYVAAPHRGHGLGRTMMSRALEICARSLFKHVFLGVDDDNVAARTLYERSGFRKIGRLQAYIAPQLG